MQCVREEIFGPVVCIMRFKTEEEAIRIGEDLASPPFAIVPVRWRH